MNFYKYMLIYMFLSFLAVLGGQYSILTVALFISMLTVHLLIEIKYLLKNGADNKR